MATYGDNFKRLREARSLSQEAVAARLKYSKERNANVSTIERSTRVPKPNTIRKHAKVLECEPRDLLVQVMTEYDRLRLTAAELAAIEALSDNPPLQSDRQASDTPPLRAKAPHGHPAIPTVGDAPQPDTAALGKFIGSLDPTDTERRVKRLARTRARKSHRKVAPPPAKESGRSKRRSGRR